MALVIGAGCVFNNIIDRDIDKLMERTKNRVLVQGLISANVAFFYAVLLGFLGFLVLYLATNLLTVELAFVGLFVYVGVYSLYLKRQSTYGTTIGGIAGAIPPMVGYAAITNQFNSGIVLLFFILFFWQMPHFYAISIYRLKDFSAASIPILPLKKNIHYTKIWMLLYIFAFTIASVLPSFFGYTGIIYAVVAFILGCTWFIRGVCGFSAENDSRWARKMFLFSILNIMILCLCMAIKT